MFTRRIATAAMLLALFGAACSSHRGVNVVAGATASTPAATPATPATAPILEPTTTTAPAPVVIATSATDTAPAPQPTPATEAPAVKSAPKPATIEVDYQPVDGATATATLTGPNGSHSKSLGSGAAIFGSLPAGTYTVTITIDTPSGDASVGDARQILNAGTLHVESGDQGVVSCNDGGCTAIL